MSVAVAPFGTAPSDVVELMERLHQGGFRVWIVGGVVRDSLLGRTPHDWDLATDAPPEALKRLGARVVPVGIRHGTVQVLTALRAIEVTAVPQAGIQADLGRRDFTINAMAVAYPSWEFLDPHGGADDLRRGRLRATADPDARFAEDPLRTLRAGRFVSELGVHIDRESYRALERAAFGLRCVAPERIREEMLRLLAGRWARRGLELMRCSGVLEVILPELTGLEGVQKRGGSLIAHSFKAVHCAPPSRTLRFAALLHHVGEGEPAQVRSGRLQELFDRWRLSKAMARSVGLLVGHWLPRELSGWSDGAVRRLVAEVGERCFADLIDLARADALACRDHEGALAEIEAFRLRSVRLLAERPPLSSGDLAVDGRDVQEALGIPPGRAVGAALHELLDRVLESPELNEREQLLRILRQKGGVG